MSRIPDYVVIIAACLAVACAAYFAWYWFWPVPEDDEPATVILMPRYSAPPLELQPDPDTGEFYLPPEDPGAVIPVPVRIYAELTPAALEGYTDPDQLEADIRTELNAIRDIRTELVRLKTDYLNRGWLAAAA